MPRTGRPIKGTSKRDQRIELRMSKDELACLDECAKRLDITRADTVNMGVQLLRRDLDAKKEE
jgi:Fe-S cluster assembly ATPase SufC